MLSHLVQRTGAAAFNKNNNNNVLLKRETNWLIFRRKPKTYAVSQDPFKIYNCNLEGIKERRRRGRVVRTLDFESKVPGSIPDHQPSDHQLDLWNGNLEFQFPVHACKYPTGQPATSWDS